MNKESKQSLREEKILFYQTTLQNTREKVEAKNLSMLTQLEQVLAQKPLCRKDLEQQFDIDFDILLSPNHPEFRQRYSLRDFEKEKMVFQVKAEMTYINRQILKYFFAYTLASLVLRRITKLRPFFRKTRFIPFFCTTGAFVFNY